MISNKSRMFKLKSSISSLFWTGAMFRLDSPSGDWTRHSGSSENRGSAQYLPTNKAVLINDYSFHIILKVIVYFLDQYSMIKYALLFIISIIYR